MATSVPSASVRSAKSANTFGATRCSSRRQAIGQLADLHVGVLGGPHRDEVPPGPVVAGHDDLGLGRVRQHRARRLPGLLAPQRRVADVARTALLQPLQQFRVGRQRRLGGLDEARRAAPGRRRSRPARPSPRRRSGTYRWDSCEYEKCRCRISSCVQRPGHAGQVERHDAVLQHRQVPDLEDVPQVARVGRGRRVGLGPGLVAGPAGELGQRLPPSASVAQGTSSGGSKCVQAIALAESIGGAY